MLIYDPLAIYFRAILLLFVALFAIFTKISGIPDQEDGPDIYTLVLGATLGMCLMVSANHLLIIFLAVEMASVPSYALAGVLKSFVTAAWRSARKSSIAFCRLANSTSQAAYSGDIFGAPSSGSSFGEAELAKMP